jgi:GDP-L-fucose synthase
MKENVLITGGNGLVGSAFNGGIKVSSKDCDLTDFLKTDDMVREYTIFKNVDSIIHAAARVGGLGDNIRHPGSFFFQNVSMNTNIIEASRRNEIKKLVCFLSTCVFPDKVEYPLDENKIHLGPPHESNFGYSYAKRMAEVQTRAYREEYGVNYTCVIPTNIYGPNDNFSLESGHVAPMLIHKCYNAMRNNNDFEIWGSGKPLREFIFSKDVAKMTEWVLENYTDDKPLILSTSHEISIKELALLIADTMGFKGKMVFDEEKPEGQFRKPSDNSIIKSYLPDFEFTKIEDGIKETIEWFISNYENCRK